MLGKWLAEMEYDWRVQSVGGLLQLGYDKIPLKHKNPEVAF